MLFILTTSLLLCLLQGQTVNPRDTYQTELKKIVNQLITSITEQQRNLTQSLNLAEQFKTQDDLATQVLKQGLNNLRSGLRTDINQTAIPYNLATWKCNTTSYQNYNKIALNNQQLLINQKTLQTQISTLSSCPQTAQLKNSIDLLQMQTNVLQSQIKYLCPVNSVDNNGKPITTNPTTPTTTTTNTTPTTNTTTSIGPTGTTTPSTGTTSTTTPATGTTTPPTGTTTPATGTTTPATGTTTPPTGTTTPATGTTTPTTTTTSTTTPSTGTTTSSTGTTTPSSGTSTPAVNQVWVNNLGNPANNWIYGNINPQQYYDGVNKQISNGAQLCPSQTPYVNANNQCINCQYLFDVSLKNCVTCPTGSFYNQTIHQCDTSSGQTVLKNSYAGAPNFIGTIPTTISNLSACPSTSPFFDGQKCINCQLPNFFDFTNKVCSACQTSKQFDTTLKICKPIDNTITPQVPIFNSNLGTSSQNYAGTPTTLTTTASFCPESQPFFNGFNCISCTLPLYFNFSSKTCSACPTSHMFDPINKTCVIDPTKVTYVSSVSTATNYIGSPPNIPVDNSKTILGCPTNAPFSNGSVCITCNLPQFFNFQTNQCQLCSTNLVFDPTLKQCKPQTTDSNSRNSNLEGSSNFMYQVPLYNATLLTCPLNTPYFNGITCITCQDPSYFNFKTLLCQTCGQGLKFSNYSRSCQYISQNFVTDTANNNILYNGLYSTLTDSILVKKTQSSATVCPPTTPFYDATRNLCISCPVDSPIFNIRFNRCISCGSGSSFNPTSHICTNNERISTTLERTLMNTFRI